MTDRKGKSGTIDVKALLTGTRGSCGSKPLHVYLRQRRHQRPLGALIAFEQFGREPSGAILRDAQLELADPDDQRPPVIA